MILVFDCFEFLCNNGGQCVLIFFIIVGDLDLEIIVKVLEVLDKNGVDMIELGVFYFDLLVDGLVI